MHADPRQDIQRRYANAMALQKTGRLAEAAQAYRALLLVYPALSEAHVQLSRIARAQGDAEARVAAIDKALALRPDDPTILGEAIAAHSDAEHHDTVLDLFDRLISRDRKAVKPQADKALYLQTAGKFDESETLFRKLLARHPHDAELYRMFAATTRFRPGDPLIGRMRKLARHPRLSPQGKMHLHFALAKALEDTGAHDKVFAHLRRANEAQQSLYPDDAGARDREWRAVVTAQKGLGRVAPPANPATTGMIFVTGLPRSGTTLVEQIIASHGQVSAGGEIGIALRAAYDCFGAGEAMRLPPTLPEDKLRRFLDRITSGTRALRKPGTDRLTDKSIMAFLVYGLLHQLLPDARFIIVHRDPRDMALSIYKNHFAAGTHRYANDLAAIAGVIKAFRSIVAHWRNTLPDRFFEIRYEDLVTRPEQETRRLVEQAGLAWDDACLDFHRRGGTIKTLSLHQARQPIYTSSAQAWKRYEAELQPFFDAWGDEPWD